MKDLPYVVFYGFILATINFFAMASGNVGHAALLWLLTAMAGGLAMAVPSRRSVWHGVLAGWAGVAAPLAGRLHLAALYHQAHPRDLGEGAALIFFMSPVIALVQGSLTGALAWAAAKPLHAEKLPNSRSVSDQAPPMTP